MITREGRKFVLRSRRGRVLGRARSKQAIVRREKQVNFFRNLRKSSGGPGSLLAKVSPALRQRVRRNRTDEELSNQ